MAATRSPQDSETHEVINKFVQKELILNSIRNALEDERPEILQRIKKCEESWFAGTGTWG